MTVLALALLAGCAAPQPSAHAVAPDQRICDTACLALRDELKRALRDRPTPAHFAELAAGAASGALAAAVAGDNALAGAAIGALAGAAIGVAIEDDAQTQERNLRRYEGHLARVAKTAEQKRRIVGEDIATEVWRLGADSRAAAALVALHRDRAEAIGRDVAAAALDAATAEALLRAQERLIAEEVGTFETLRERSMEHLMVYCRALESLEGRSCAVVFPEVARSEDRALATRDAQETLWRAVADQSLTPGTRHLPCPGPGCPADESGVARPDKQVA